MDYEKLMTGCASCGMNRRQFFGKTALAAGSALSLTASGFLQAAPKAGKIKIRIIYALHAAQQVQPDWPNKDFDFVPIMERCNTALGKQFPNMEFIPTLATGEEQAKKILADDQSLAIDGYLVYQMNCWNRVVQTMATSGKPVLYADFQFGGSGGFLVYTAALLRNKAANVGFIASSRIEDVLDAVKCFADAKKSGSAANFAAAVARSRVKHTPKPGNLECKPDPLQRVSTEECVQKLRASKILAVRGTDAGPAQPMMSIPVEYVPFAEVNDAWVAADKDQAKAIADQWQSAAALIEGVSRETLEQSAAMYLAQKAVMQKHGANAITINCLGGFYGGHIHAYPCLGFHQLLNDGMIGGCECDVRSTAALVTVNALSGGRPGYISDPVIDTARRTIIYAHCVASNRAFGPTGVANPFQILTHSEDRQGASVRSILPVGYKTTTIEIAQDRKQILMHLAKVVANDPDDRACRTKLVAEPLGDMEKLFGAWDQWGWHRVTCYGDLKAGVYALADSLGWQVIEEA
jgi:hypothetical protein